MSKLKRRMVFDLLLTAMLVFEMFYQFTGNALHEYVGFAFFACIAVHLLLSRRWIGSTAGLVGTGRMNRRRKGLAVMALLLFIDLLVLGASSIVISNTLWSLGADFSILNPGDVWVPVHSASAYGLCALVLVHLAMHWVQVAGVMKIEYDPSRRRAIGQCVGAVVGLGAIALGVAGAKQTGISAAANAASALEPDVAEDLEDVTDVVVQDAAATGSGTVSGDAGSASSASSARGGKSHGAGNRKDRSGSSSATTETAPQSQQDAVPSEPQESVQESSTGSTSAVSGTCPLCRKQCSLSNPKCDRPYQEGLL